ncbi:hypothetical protein PV327_004497 [Microctonus hyperodae]|uniref:Ig-like domain-containing protein n=1 Tax=Microctonus hyperodae TaxID=165561 RepID=A0AA39KML2_MICHY|nr:hypothetical protein PV327_004497 [Microctonus hyperodae]
MCRLGIPLQFCRAEIPGEQSMMLKFGEPPEDGIEYFGDGPQTGQCGVRIQKIKDSHDGIFKCGITTNLSRTEVLGTVRIVVAKPPREPELILSPGSIGRNKYKNSEKLSITCSAPYGRPAANVSLYLDNQPLSREYGVTNYDPSGGNNSLAVQKVSYSLKWTDNGKTLRCVVDHIALDHPKEITRQLEVYYPPQPQPTIERFGYVIGRPGVINVSVDANPRPRFVWRVNDEKINEGHPDMSNRLETSSAVDMGRGIYLVELKIDSVQKSDTEKEYILEARNDEGAAEYHIKLSTSSEPEGFDLDAGYIIGIVIGVLVLLLLIFIIIFARATGRWCFAARRRGDEEAAGGAGAGSEAHITPGDDDDDDHENPHITDEKIPHGGQENPIHASTEYVNGRNDIKDVQRKDEKTDTPV